MKVVYIIIFLAVVELSRAKKKSSIPEKDLQEWKSFKVSFEKSYGTKEKALKKRNIFLGHLKFVREHNAKYENGTETYRVGINKFADLSTAEFIAQRNGFKVPAGWKRNGLKFNLTDKVTNSSVDWRLKGAVTPVKDQGECGSCWAFSATGSLEGQNYIKRDILYSLSEQNLMDCSRSNGNRGCEGGVIDYAFEYVKSNNGIDKDFSYPYTGTVGKCRYKASNKGTSCSGYVDLPEGSECYLLKAVTNVGPISAAMDASLESFQLYESGVYAPSSCSTTNLGHAVLVVGYGTASGNPYWLVKNSWGTDWGLSGYLMLARNKDNMCGIATAASYPIV